MVMVDFTKIVVNKLRHRSFQYMAALAQLKECLGDGLPEKYLLSLLDGAGQEVEVRNSVTAP